MWTTLGFGVLGKLAGESPFRITHVPWPSRQSHIDRKNLMGGGSFRILVTQQPVPGMDLSGVIWAKEHPPWISMPEYWSQSMGIHTMPAPLNKSGLLILAPPTKRCYCHQHSVSNMHWDQLSLESLLSVFLIWAPYLTSILRLALGNNNLVGKLSYPWPEYLSQDIIPAFVFQLLTGWRTLPPHPHLGLRQGPPFTWFYPWK